MSGETIGQLGYLGLGVSDLLPDARFLSQCASLILGWHAGPSAQPDLTLSVDDVTVQLIPGWGISDLAEVRPLAAFLSQ